MKYRHCGGIEFESNSGSTYCRWWKGHACSATTASFKPSNGFTGATCFVIQTTDKIRGSECSNTGPADECASGSCKGGFCCGKKGSPPAYDGKPRYDGHGECDECNRNGACKTCSIGSTFSEWRDPHECFFCEIVEGEYSGKNGVPCIIPRRPAGNRGYPGTLAEPNRYYLASSCSSDSECSSGSCRYFYEFHYTQDNVDYGANGPDWPTIEVGNPTANRLDWLEPRVCASKVEARRGMGKIGCKYLDRFGDCSMCLPGFELVNAMHRVFDQGMYCKQIGAQEVISP